jgi:hypothetical protein
MKTIYLTIALFALLAISKLSKGQIPNDCPNKLLDCFSCSDCTKDNENIKELIYDFECKLFYFEGEIVTNLNDLTLAKNESLILRIENVNRYVYSVEVGIEELKFVSETPQMFSSLILGAGIEIPFPIDSESESIEEPLTDAEDSDSIEEAFLALTDVIKSLPSFKGQTIPYPNISLIKSDAASELASELLTPLNLEFSSLISQVESTKQIALQSIDREVNLANIDSSFEKLNLANSTEVGIQASLLSIGENSSLKDLLITDSSKSLLTFLPIDKEKILSETVQTLLLSRANPKMKNDFIESYNKKITSIDSLSEMSIDYLKSTAIEVQKSFDPKVLETEITETNIQTEFKRIYKIKLGDEFENIKDALINEQRSISSEIENYILSEFLFNNSYLQPNEINNENLLYIIESSSKDEKYFESLTPSHTNELIVKNSQDYLKEIEVKFKFSSEVLENYLLNQLNSPVQKGEDSKLEKDRKEILVLLNSLFAIQMEALSVCELDRPCCDGKENLDYNSIMEKINDYKASFEKKTHGLKSKISKQKSLIEDLTKKDGKCTELTKQENEEKDPIKKTELKQKLNELKCSENALKLKEANDALKKLEDELAEIEMTSKDILSLKNEDIMKLILFSKNYTAENYKYRMPIYFPNSSFTNLNIQISALDTAKISLSPQMPLYNQSNSISVFQKGHWNAGFSTGPFFTVGRSLSDQRYVWGNLIERTPLGNDTTVLKIIKNDKRNRFMGLASTMNINYQNTRSFSYGFSFGAGISIEDKPRQNYLGGINIAFGTEHPFIIGAGILTTRVDRFNELVYGNPNLNYKEKVDIDYNKIWTTGGYFMVSYSIVKTDIKKTGNNK